MGSSRFQGKEINMTEGEVARTWENAPPSISKPKLRFPKEKLEKKKIETGLCSSIMGFEPSSLEGL